MSNEPEPTKVPGASEGEVKPPVPPTPPPAGSAPKAELKDGAIFVDGKKMVAESDLIAAKKSSEKQMETQQTAHTQALDTAKLELSDEQKTSANLNAKLTEATQARESGAISAEELARIKGEAETAKGSLESANKRILELRVASIVASSGGTVTAESLAEKTIEQLDSFEEAIKAVIASKGGGPGNYAIGGGLGGTAPKTNLERAAEVLANTPIRGVREPVPQK